MSHTRVDSTLPAEVRPPPASDQQREAMAMLHHSRPGPVPGLKHRFALEIEETAKRHTVILTDAELAFASVETGVTWLRRCLSEELELIKCGHDEILIKFNAITATINAAAAAGTAEAASQPHHAMCRRRVMQLHGPQHRPVRRLLVRSL